MTAEFAYPALGREIDESRNVDRAIKLKRAIHYARLCQALASGDTAASERFLGAFWKGGLGKRYYETYVEERFRFFLKHHALIVDRLADLPATTGLDFGRLVEIGCGDGRVLAYCAERLPWVSQAIGLDINPAIIARNSANPSFDSKTAFVAAEAGRWLQHNPQRGTVVLTNNGVLEYFSQDSFDRLLTMLGNARPAAIALIEPIAAEHDLTQPESMTFGYEKSFSHNHRLRVSGAGYEIIFEREMQISNIRWMLMIGIAS